MQVYPTIKDPTVSGADHVKRFNISFLNRDVKLKGLFWPCPRSTKLKMVLNIFNKEEMTKARTYNPPLSQLRFESTRLESIRL